MITLGIDSGVTGALCLVDTTTQRLVAYLDMPVIRFGPHALVDGTQVLDWLDGRKWELTVVESVEARMPSATSAMKLGAGFGGISSLLLATSVPIRFVRAAAWKKRAGLSADKGQALALARATFGHPDEFRRAKDIGRAEAALIALHGAGVKGSAFEQEAA